MTGNHCSQNSLQAFLLCQGTTLKSSRTKAMHSNFYDTFVPLPEFALHIPQLWPRISAKIYLMNQGNWLKGSRWSQIKQKGSNQIFLNGQQGIKLKNADGKPSLSQVSKFPKESGPKPLFTNAYGTAYRSSNTISVTRHKYCSEHPSHTHSLKATSKKRSRNCSLHFTNLYYKIGTRWHSVSQERHFLNRAAQESIGVLAGYMVQSTALRHSSLQLASLLMFLGGHSWSCRFSMQCFPTSEQPQLKTSVSLPIFKYHGHRIILTFRFIILSYRAFLPLHINPQNLPRPFVITSNLKKSLTS